VRVESRLNRICNALRILRRSVGSIRRGLGLFSLTMCSLGYLGGLISALTSHIGFLARLIGPLDSYVCFLVCSNRGCPNHGELLLRCTSGKKRTTSDDKNRRYSGNCVHCFCSI